MHKIRLIAPPLAASLLILGLAAPSYAVQVVKTKNTTVNLDTSLQGTFTFQNLQDKMRSDNRLYMYLNRARLAVTGKTGDTHYFTRFELGPNAPGTTNAQLGLLDAGVDVPFVAGMHIRVGQFKIPYGREQLTSSDSRLFNDQVSEFMGFQTGRALGGALEYTGGPASFILGIQGPGGRDVPTRYLPQLFGTPIITLRLGVGNEGGDPYELKEHVQSTTTRQGFYLNGLFVKDTTIGHSTAFNVWGNNSGPYIFQKPLLIDSNFNPYVSRSAGSAGVPTNYAGEDQNQGQMAMAGGDYALHVPFSDATGLDAQAEYDWGQYSDVMGQEVHLNGGEAQVGYYFNPFEVALRYGVLFPDQNMAPTVTVNNKPTIGNSIFGNNGPMSEITPAINWKLNHNTRLTLDIPVYLNAPVAEEGGGVGSYLVIPQEPGETSQAGAQGATNNIVRQTVVEAQVGLDYLF